MTDVENGNQLWEATPPANQLFDPGQLSRLPETARRYLCHAIAPGTPLASTVRVRMRGEIRLNRWFPFTAEQVIAWDRGMVWTATVRMFGIPIHGFDQWIDHAGSMNWKILGLIPMMQASGEDVTRACIGRIVAESVWLPSILCRETATWTETDTTHTSVCMAVDGEHSPLTLTIDAEGRLQSNVLQRWGNPEGGEHHYLPFGGIVEQEKTFGGYTIPTRLRVGWYFGTPRFETEGEFFRCVLTDLEYR